MSGSVLEQSAYVAGAQLAVDLCEGEADAIAVGQRRGWVDLKFGQRDARCFDQSAKLSGFIAKLCRVGEMLELASAARAEVRAWGNRGSGFEVRGSRLRHIRPAPRGACRRG